MDLFVVPTISFRCSMLADHGSWSVATAVVRNYCISNGRMDRQSAHRVLRLGAKRHHLSGADLCGLFSRGVVKLSLALSVDVIPSIETDKHGRTEVAFRVGGAVKGRWIEFG